MNTTPMKCPQYTPIPVVRVGIIGLGTRGMRAVHRFIHMEGAVITGLSDLLPAKIEIARQTVHTRSLLTVEGYAGAEGWKALCDSPDIDLVYICTDWLSHTPISLYALNQGKQVAVEVPAATTVDECWQLVETVEKTGQRLMMLENCCYDLFELNTLNMVRHGLFGEIMHGEGAYIHDLRKLIFAAPEKGGFQNYWHKDFNTRHSGNTYPTHGLGPVCQAMGIRRGGDRMTSLVSLSTRQAGLTAYARARFGEDSEEARQPYQLGDFSSTIIRTEQGHTLLLKNSMTLPRPYSRIYALSGTKGYIVKYPLPLMTLEPDADAMLTTAQMEQWMEEYRHPYVREVGERAVRLCGERARDYIMDYRLIHCLREGLPFDMDVYDAAAWSSIIELSEQSVNRGGAPVDIPDFTSARTLPSL